MEKRYSAAYIDQITQGPFPGQIDPWSEYPRYFQQIHSGMIDHILEQIRRPLLELGYIAGKETSLQIIAGREPDIFVRPTTNTSPALHHWNYAEAATAIMTEPGIEAEKPDLQAIEIKELQTSLLVTVLEIVSPGNKSEIYPMDEYVRRRTELLLSQGVNVVEIDATRSVKRLLDHPLTAAHHYHTAIYLPFENPRLHLNDFLQPLKRFALPLRGQVVAVEPQTAYNQAYQRATIAGHILNEGKYTLSDLRFPSLLTNDQRQLALQNVHEWHDQLARLASG
jgi:Protein of unknown function (DUF4058)